MMGTVLGTGDVLMLIRYRYRLHSTFTHCRLQYLIGNLLSVDGVHCTVRCDV